MPGSSKRYSLFILIILILVLDISLFYLDLRSFKGVLTLAILDVGQGDAIFIESPTGTQVMFDVGPARRILGPFSKIMSPFDRTIDAIVITNPDADHIGGFAEILKNYEIGAVIEPGTLNDSKTFQNIKSEIKNKNIPNILARRGMRLHIGGGAFIDILFPDRDVSTWATNDGSVVARLSYGEFSVMLTGDATTMTEKIILTENEISDLESLILKVGHHGSRSSSSSSFINAVGPSYAVISVGEDNKYGHPHKDVLGLLEDKNIETLRTDVLGTIVFESNGEFFQIR